MRKYTIIASVTLLFMCFSVYQFILAEGQPNSKEDMMIKKAIVGTWQLVSRELPDGTVLNTPQISGLMIYTGKYACTNTIDIVGAEKKLHAYSMSMTYEISGSKMRGKVLLNAGVTQGSEGKYDTQPTDFEVEMLVEGSKISFKPFPWSEQVIEGDTWTQTSKNFKDTWKKVE